MTITITITYSETAQRGALKAGLPAAATQTYDVPQALAAEVLDLPWAQVHPDGNVTCVIPNRIGWSERDLREPIGTPPAQWNYGYGYGVFVATCDYVPSTSQAEAAIAHGKAVQALLIAHLDERRAALAAEEKARDEQDRAQALEWAALPLAWRATRDGVARCSGPGSGPGPLATSGTVRYSLDALRSHAPAALAEAEAEAARLAAAAKAEAEAAKAAGVATLRAWAQAHGSELLRARIADGYDWQTLAEREWGATIVAPLGAEVEEPDTRNVEAEERTTPALCEIEACRAARAALAGQPAEVGLYWLTYDLTDEDDDGATVVKRAEIRVVVTTPTGRDLIYWFPA